MYSRKFLKLLAAFVTLPLVVLGIPKTEFYSYGLEARDQSLPPSNTGSSPAVSLDMPFPFYGSNQTTAFVSMLYMHAGLPGVVFLVSLMQSLLWSKDDLVSAVFLPVQTQYIVYAL